MGAQLRVREGNRLRERRQNTGLGGGERSGRARGRERNKLQGGWESPLCFTLERSINVFRWIT